MCSYKKCILDMFLLLKIRLNSDMDILINTELITLEVFFVSSLTLNVLFLTVSSFVNFTFPSTTLAGNFFHVLSHFPYFATTVSAHVSLTGALC